MADKAQQSRRAFLETLGYTSTVLALGGYAPRPTLAANDTIGVGVIGCGGRARGRLMPRLKQMPGVRLVGVCDVFDPHRDAARHVAGDQEIFSTRYHEELLDRADVDAVLIAGPDHWHARHVIDACEAGKDVYVEKPLTHTLNEGDGVIAAANRHERIVQVGTQQRSMPHFAEARKLIEQGTLGRVRKVRMTWNRNFLPFQKRPFNIDPTQIDWERFVGPAPEQPLDAYRMANWRWFWDFGGGIFTDLMVHWHDAAVWMLGLGLPDTVASIGDHFATADAWQTPDTVNTLMRFEQAGFHVQFEGTFVASRHRAHMEIYGEDAALYLDRGRYELHPEPNRDMEPRQRILGEGGRGRDFYDEPDADTLHLADWIDATRERRKPLCPAEDGVTASAAAHLANVALREQRLATGHDR